MSRFLLKPVLSLCLLTLLVCLTWAANERVAMVIETKGKNFVSFNGVKAPMRTLQVLPQGARVEVELGATLRLSYFKSGTKETIVGPCEVEIQELGSLKISEDGDLKAKSARDSNTDLPGTENLRRTGGALQGYKFSDSPDQRLARMDFQETYYVSPAQQSNGGFRTGTTTVSRPTRGGAAGFLGRQRTYIDATKARKVAWQSAAKNLTLRLWQGDEEALRLEVQGGETQIPIELEPGKEYKLELIGSYVLAESSFSVLTAQQARDVLAAENLIRREESTNSRPLYVRLLRLQSELGLYSQAEKTAEAALEVFPDDSGFLFMAALLKEELGEDKQARELLERAKKVEADLYR